MGGRFKREGIYGYLGLIHVELWQKATNFCRNLLKKKKSFSTSVPSLTKGPSPYYLRRPCVKINYQCIGSSNTLPATISILLRKKHSASSDLMWRLESNMKRELWGIFILLPCIYTLCFFLCTHYTGKYLLKAHNPQWTVKNHRIHSHSSISGMALVEGTQ